MERGAAALKIIKKKGFEERLTNERKSWKLPSDASPSRDCDGMLIESFAPFE